MAIATATPLLISENFDSFLSTLQKLKNLDPNEEETPNTIKSILQSSRTCTEAKIFSLILYMDENCFEYVVLVLKYADLSEADLKIALALCERHEGLFENDLKIVLDLYKKYSEPFSEDSLEQPLERVFSRLTTSALKWAIETGDSSLLEVFLKTAPTSDANLQPLQALLEKTFSSSTPLDLELLLNTFSSSVRGIQESLKTNASQAFKEILKLFSDISTEKKK